jgi:hypothetical protein
VQSEGHRDDAERARLLQIEPVSRIILSCAGRMQRGKGVGACPDASVTHLSNLKITGSGTVSMYSTLAVSNSVQQLAITRR